MKKNINISHSRMVDLRRVGHNFDEYFRFIIKKIFPNTDYIFNIVPSAVAEYVVYFGHEFRAKGSKPGDFRTDPTHPHVKIFLTWEPPSKDNFDDYDWIYSWVYDDMVCRNNHMRFPFYYLFDPYGKIESNKENLENILSKKTKFCNFIYSREVRIRNEFFRKLSKYKKVDAPGKCCNNMPRLEKPVAGGPTVYKPFDFLNQYKFSISFENSSFIGYTTEKVLESSLSTAIPIYWGNPWIHRDFNVNRLIDINEDNDPIPGFGKNYAIYDYSQYPSKILTEKMDEAIEKIIKLDNHDDIYIEMAGQPYINKPDVFSEKLAKRASDIFG